MNKSPENNNFDKSRTGEALDAVDNSSESIDYYQRGLEDIAACKKLTEVLFKDLENKDAQIKDLKSRETVSYEDRAKTEKEIEDLKEEVKATKAAQKTMGKVAIGGMILAAAAGGAVGYGAGGGFESEEAPDKAVAEEFVAAKDDQELGKGSLTGPSREAARKLGLFYEDPFGVDSVVAAAETEDAAQEDLQNSPSAEKEDTQKDNLGDYVNNQAENKEKDDADKTAEKDAAQETKAERNARLAEAYEDGKEFKNYDGKEIKGNTEIANWMRSDKTNKYNMTRDGLFELYGKNIEEGTDEEHQESLAKATFYNEDLLAALGLTGFYAPVDAAGNKIDVNTTNSSDFIKSLQENPALRAQNYNLFLEALKGTKTEVVNLTLENTRGAMAAFDYDGTTEKHELGISRAFDRGEAVRYKLANGEEVDVLTVCSNVVIYDEEKEIFALIPLTVYEEGKVDNPAPSYKPTKEKETTTPEDKKKEEEKPEEEKPKEEKPEEEKPEEEKPEEEKPEEEKPEEEKPEEEKPEEEPDEKTDIYPEEPEIETPEQEEPGQGGGEETGKDIENMVDDKTPAGASGENKADSGSLEAQDPTATGQEGVYNNIEDRKADEVKADKEAQVITKENEVNNVKASQNQVNQNRENQQTKEAAVKPNLANDVIKEQNAGRTNETVNRTQETKTSYQEVKQTASPNVGAPAASTPAAPTNSATPEVTNDTRDVNINDGTTGGF